MLTFLFKTSQANKKGRNHGVTPVTAPLKTFANPRMPTVTCPEMLKNYYFLLRQNSILKSVDK